MDETARMKILEMIESGKITAAEGLRLLEALSAQTEDTAEENSGMEEGPIPVSSMDESIPPPSPSIPPSEDNEETTTASEEPEPSSQKQASQPEFISTSALPPDAEKWRRWWMLPLWVGVGTVVLAGAWMYAAYENNGFSFWFLCSWIPFLFGVLLMAISFGSRRARWLHLRVTQAPGEKPQNIAISFPLPIRLASWFFRNFGHYIPEVQNKPIDEILAAVDHSTGPDNPLYIEVDEGKNGEKVKIYIG